MKLLPIVPIASLALVTGVLVAAAFYDPPIDFPFTEPPEGAPPMAPDLGIGELTMHGVVRGEDGTPLDGAGVSLFQAGRPLFAWTRADGSFTIEEIHGGGATVRVMALGYQATSIDVPSLESGSAADPLVLMLDRPVGQAPPVTPMVLGTLHGSVDFGPEASAEPGYELLLTPTSPPHLASGGFPRRVAVDANGHFELTHLQEGEYWTILLAPEDRGGHQPDLLADADGTSSRFTFEAGDELPSLELRSTAGAAVGTVLGPAAGGDAQPVRGALIRAERLLASGEAAEVDRALFRATRTDADGRYVLRDLAPGRYRLSLVAGLRRQVNTVTVAERATVRNDFEATDP